MRKPDMKYLVQGNIRLTTGSTGIRSEGQCNAEPEVAIRKVIDYPRGGYSTPGPFAQTKMVKRAVL